MTKLITRTLGEICDEVQGIIKTGPFGSQLHESDYSEEGTPVVMPKDIIDGRVSVESIAHIDDDVLAKLAHHKLERGDIVYGRRGDIGRRALITERESGWLCGTGCIRLSFGDSVLDSGFLYYYLGQSKVVAWITKQAVGATMPNLNSTIVRSVPISYPPLAAQRKIAAILSAYDDLIENNTRRIKILEEMAQMLYREWFVNFRFPGHDKVRMVKSKLEQVPEGWEVKKLGDVIELAYGKGLKADQRKEGAVPVFGSGGLVGYHNQSLVQGPGIIVGRKGNVGSAFWSEVDFFPIDTVFYVVTKLPLHYIFYNLLGQNFVNNDAAVPGLNRNQAYLNRILLPKSNVLEQFENIVTPMFHQIRALELKNANLRRTRDLLLPKLISGEVEVEGLDIKGVADAASV